MAIGDTILLFFRLLLPRLSITPWRLCLLRLLRPPNFRSHPPGCHVPRLRPPHRSRFLGYSYFLRRLWRLCWTSKRCLRRRCHCSSWYQHCLSNPPPLCVYLYSLKTQAWLPSYHLQLCHDFHCNSQLFPHLIQLVSNGHGCTQSKQEHRGIFQTWSPYLSVASQIRHSGISRKVSLIICIQDLPWVAFHLRSSRASNNCYIKGTAEEKSKNIKNKGKDKKYRWLIVVDLRMFGKALPLPSSQASVRKISALTALQPPPCTYKKCHGILDLTMNHKLCSSFSLPNQGAM
jgi:hypothetical protein